MKAFLICTAVLLLMILSGCGNKGDLYHPTAETGQQTSVSKSHANGHETDVSI
ncbi:MAG: hypothetical protein DWP95_08675 [Proteobacteria bacterium]|nr:MAG: hypothetical protein DWP95_08675 [Pseudomonadota bacterium]